MRRIRIHTEQALLAGSSVALAEQASEHIVRVLRMEVGNRVTLFNGDGNEYDAELTSVTKRAVTVQVSEQRAVDNESPLQLTLVQAVARGEKMDWILQKATELGVAKIVPVITERTEVKLDEDRAERRIAHWRAVIASACEQSGRTRLPEIGAPLRLPVWAGSLTDNSTLRLALLPQGEVGLRDVASEIQGAVIVIGPEGGFSSTDIAILRAGNFRGLRLGPRILRTETAGPAILAALNALAGDFS